MHVQYMNKHYNNDDDEDDEDDNDDHDDHDNDDQNKNSKMTTKKPRSYLKFQPVDWANHKTGSLMMAPLIQSICTMVSFSCYYQNPSGFCFLLQIRAIAILTSLGLTNLYMKEKKINSGLTCNSKKTSS